MRLKGKRLSNAQHFEKERDLRASRDLMDSQSVSGHGRALAMIAHPQLRPRLF
jgi:hypothetical protein